MRFYHDRFRLIINSSVRALYLNTTDIEDSRTWKFQARYLILILDLYVFGLYKVVCAEMRALAIPNPCSPKASYGPDTDAPIKRSYVNISTSTGADS